MAAESHTRMQTSKESDAEQLKLAKRQGESFDAAVRNMTEKEAHGQQMRAGDFLIGVAVEHAEGLYRMRDGRLQWEEPTDENAHVEIVVRDVADGRFIPGLSVHATLVDGEGTVVGTHEQPFLWHPWLYHYGRNWTVPGSGEYTVRVDVEPPDFPRHDKKNGRRYAERVSVDFHGIRVDAGQKRS